MKLWFKSSAGETLTSTAMKRLLDTNIPCSSKIRTTVPVSADTCVPGKRIQSEDGCNSCECLDGIRVVCTDMECVYLSKPEKHKSGSSSGHGKHSRRSNPV
uniref:Pacifastin domain-containing protein n=1 Tax=Timema poppense TaxID=170557 RepID=A0A7R9HF71_TIMPO|nr:unnamed protein product [Timema poppensis]